jgi:hypothetical protein
MAMRILAPTLAFLVALAATAPVDAQVRREGRKAYDRDRQAYQYRRSSTVDRDGRCQRDTGRPLDSLNLSHRCDREEFWERFNGGDNRR